MMYIWWGLCICMKLKELVKEKKMVPTFIAFAEGFRFFMIRCTIASLVYVYCQLSFNSQTQILLPPNTHPIQCSFSMLREIYVTSTWLNIIITWNGGSGWVVFWSMIMCCWVEKKLLLLCSIFWFSKRKR